MLRRALGVWEGGRGGQPGGGVFWEYGQHSQRGPGEQPTTAPAALGGRPTLGGRGVCVNAAGCEAAADGGCAAPSGLTGWWRGQADCAGDNHPLRNVRRARQRPTEQHDKTQQHKPSSPSPSSGQLSLRQGPRSANSPLASGTREMVTLVRAVVSVVPSRATFVAAIVRVVAGAAAAAAPATASSAAPAPRATGGHFN